jgi:hypothetical protein
MSDSQHSSQPADDTSFQQLGAETRGQWRRVSTTQTMHDGTLLLTWGVQVSDTQQWVGKAHALGDTLEDKAESFANAGLFASSKEMAVLLHEATQVWADQFDDTGPDSPEISGADLLDWFAQWRLRAKKLLEVAVTP